MLKNISIGTRLWLGFGLILLLFVSISLLIINQLGVLSNLTNLMYRHPLTVSNAVLRIDGNIVRIHRSMKDVVLAGDAAEMEKAVQLVDRYEKEVYNDFEIVAERFLGDQEMYLAAEYAFEEWKPIRDEVITLMRQGKRDEAAAITTGKGAVQVEKLQSAMAALNEFAQHKARSFLDDALQTRANTFRVAYGLVITAILMGTVLNISLIRSINRPLSDLMAVVLEISHGNLDRRVAVGGKNEIGQLAQAFNNMADKLKSSNTNLEEKISQRTWELARANEDLVAMIANQQRTAEALHLQTQALDNMLNGVSIIRASDGIILYTNPAFETMLGYPKDDLLGQHISRITPSTEQSFEEGSAEIVLALERDGRWEGEVENVRKDGSSFWAYAKVSTFEHSEHDLLWITVQEDVTERKRMAAENEKLTAQFYQAQKMESIGRLAGGIAHDFNNLLVPIIGYAELGMLTVSPGSKQHIQFDQIREAGERAANLSRQILAFSRQQVLEMVTLDLNKLVGDFETMLKRLIGEDIILRTHLDPELPLIKADKGQIEQVLLNLVINARDALPNGGRLTIETARVFLDEAYAAKHTETQPERYAMLAVSDTGCGMDAATRQHIFEPFFTTKSRGQGTGLGLATVFGIVKQHQGNIWVYSEPGRGTTFKVYLPAGEMSTLGDLNAGSEATNFDTLNGTETILVVEDELRVGQLVCDTLTTHGYRVLMAQNPVEGLAIASTHQGAIDLLLTDVIMPDLNGRELYQQITVLRPGLKVLYMSGYTNNIIAHHGVLDEELAFLQKPFAIQDLLQKVRIALR